MKVFGKDMDVTSETTNIDLNTSIKDFIEKEKLLEAAKKERYKKFDESLKEAMKEADNGNANKQ